MSCPPLQRSAYVGETLEPTLGRVTRDFLRGPENDLSDPQRIAVSALFDWYGEDFVEAAGSVQAFVSTHSGLPVSPEAEVEPGRHPTESPADTVTEEVRP